MTSYHPEDLIDVRIDADLFQARVTSTNERYVVFVPLDENTYGYRYCHYSDVVRVLGRPGAEEAVG